MVASSVSRIELSEKQAFFTPKIVSKSESGSHVST